MNKKEFDNLSCTEKTLYLEGAFKASGASLIRRKKMHGKACNDAPYMVKVRCGVDRLVCPAYACWHGVISRSLSKKVKESRPAYDKASVCDDWLSFMAFRKWWLEHQVDGWQIDKDILGDSKVYCPETCIFVPPVLNLFITDTRSIRGDWPIGVYLEKDRGQFMSRCHNPFTKKHQFLGRFSDPESAHLAWVERKTNHAESLRCLMDSIDKRIYGRVMELVLR